MFVGGLDQGTTGTLFVIFDADGRVAGSAYREHRQIHPRPGRAEHDADEILANAKTVLRDGLGSAGLQADQLAAIGIANQTETFVLWDRHTGEPTGNAVTWQDLRGEERCAELRDRGLEATIRERTGLPLHSDWTAPKLASTLSEQPRLRQRAAAGDVLAGTMDTWLAWNLSTGPRSDRHVTDYSNASRTMLMDLHRLDWDMDLLDIFGIPRAMLPGIRPCTDLGAAHTLDASVLGAAIPIPVSLGDQQAALIGQACFSRGDAKMTIGTGTFLMANLGPHPMLSDHGLATSVGYGRERATCTYVLEASIPYAGAVFSWLEHSLGLISSVDEAEALASAVPNSGGVHFVPAFSGLYAPYWDMTARGTISGLTSFADRRHLLRAAYEGIAFQARDVLSAMERDLGTPFTSLKVDGGASRSDLLMQLLADTIGVPMLRPAVTEATALGAAILAGLAVGVWNDTAEVAGLWRADRRFNPVEPRGHADERYAAWTRAVDRIRGS